MLAEQLQNLEMQKHNYLNQNFVPHTPPAPQGIDILPPPSQFIRLLRGFNLPCLGLHQPLIPASPASPADLKPQSTSLLCPFFTKQNKTKTVILDYFLSFFKIIFNCSCIIRPSSKADR